MALPDFSTVKSLDHAHLGSPFVEGPAKDSISTQSLDYALLGAPFVRNDLAAVGGGGTNIQINIGDSWKSVSAMKINIGDVWKDVVSVKQNIGDVWKTVF